MVFPDLSKVHDLVEGSKNEFSITIKLNRQAIERDPLDIIRFITRVPKDLEIALRHAVKVARDQGHTWQEIGDAIGLTRQAAWERYATDITDVA